MKQKMQTHARAVCKHALSKKRGGRVLFAAVFVLCAVCCVLAGCTKEQSASTKGEHKTGALVKQQGNAKRQKVRVGFSVATDTFIIERWNKDIRIFTSEMASRGAEVLLQLSAGGSEAQIKQIEFLVSQGIDALVVIPHDSDLLSGVIQQVIEKGIPVVAYDRMVNGVPLSAYVSFDNVQVGRLMAESLVAVRPVGNYFIVNGSLHDSNSFEVNRGIYSVIQPHIQAGRIEVKKEIWLDEWSFDEALQKVGNTFEHSTDFVAITSGNDQIAEAILQLLAERRLAGKIPVTGQDAELSACQHIVEGIQLMTVYKPINKLASLAADVTIKLVRREPLLPDTYVSNGSTREIPYFKQEVYAVTKDNMGETVIKDGFHSEQDIYRNQPRSQNAEE